jgi:REP element-mobilizing transposase RayT
MARKLRVEYPGAIYHVMNRGDHREPIFRDDTDRQRFISTLGEACDKTEWRVHAWCLMANHFHLVLAGQSGGRNEMVVGRLHQPLQSPAQTLRSSVQ